MPADPADLRASVATVTAQVAAMKERQDRADETLTRLTRDLANALERQGRDFTEALAQHSKETQLAITKHGEIIAATVGGAKMLALFGSLAGVFAFVDRLVGMVGLHGVIGPRN